ncbi:unnamed protein product [Trichogramma brassicae]|uniref:Uncharacterized protein n=1 Tax=Trichogramma brassicae TaxID=86971 RepID=A0A6H5IXF8_9HYME|nr:unnamed protein product [Trichogramma brassicae]
MLRPTRNAKFHIDQYDEINIFQDHGGQEACFSKKHESRISDIGSEKATGGPHILYIVNIRWPVFLKNMKAEYIQNLRRLQRSDILHNAMQDKSFSSLKNKVTKEDSDCEKVKLFFQINDELNQLVQIDARDKLGNTPIHLALEHGDQKKMMEIMLRRGASPNLANDKGSTPLHIISKRHTYYCDDLTEYFFKINDELNQRVQVDARDRLGRTPLQCAVVNCSPYAVESLLNHGANLSSFVFPTSSDFDDSFESDRYNHIRSKCSLAFGLLAVIECLEKKGYELNRSEVLIIMKLFDKYKLFEVMEDFDERWFDDEEFAKEARETMVKPDFSIYDLFHSRPPRGSKTTDLYGLLWLSKSRHI